MKTRIYAAPAVKGLKHTLSDCANNIVFGEGDIYGFLQSSFCSQFLKFLHIGYWGGGRKLVQWLKLPA